MRPLALLLALGGLLALAPPAVAQTTGKITGRVTDSRTGETLPGVNVVIEGSSVGASTNLDGEYIIIGVRPGGYTLTASYVGYSATRVENVRVSVDLTTTIDIQLREQIVEGQEVVVEADAQLVRRDLTSTEFRVTSETIDNLPVQEVGDILRTQAGITSSGGGISIRGGRSKEIAYFVDGVRVTDSYDGSVSVQIETDGIEELQVIAGTFNAEYGQAMSGIINVITKDPSTKFEGSFKGFAGTYAVGFDTQAGEDYLRGANFRNYDIQRVNAQGDSIAYYQVDPYSYLGFNPGQYYDLSASLSGPILANRLGFYVLGRYFKNDGWLYGTRIFNTDGTPGDQALVPMNTFERYSGQAKLKLNLRPGMSFTLSGLASYGTGDAGDIHFNRWNPDGLAQFFETGYNLNAQFTHAVSARTFYTLNATNYYKKFQRYMYEDVQDLRYNTPFTLNNPQFIFVRDDQGNVVDTLNVLTGPGRFGRGGVDLGRFQRSSNTIGLKGDVTSQITKNHLVKLGVEAIFDNNFLESYGLTRDDSGTSPNGLRIPDATTNAYQRFDDVRPFTFSAYVQDKMEFEAFIVNAGLRFDYFNSSGEIPSDPEDPNVFNPQKFINRFNDENGNGQIDPSEVRDDNRTTLDQRLGYWYEPADTKIQLSPRLGVAYPITETGVIHFSYGHFLQIPTFEFLFNNPGYRVSTSVGLYGPYGNANLDPQRTVMYEIGLKQSFGEDYLMELTGFYRDVRDWVSVGFPISAALPGVDYIVYTNLDYSNVRGLTLAFEKRFSGNFSFSADYTFQVAEGSNSNPDEAIAARQGAAAPRLQIIPLDWDQRHTFNASFYTGGQNWGVSTIARLGSGYPYSPTQPISGTVIGVQPTNPANANRRPSSFEMDLYAFRDFTVGPVRPRLFVQVYNLLDARTVNGVYGDTGLPDITLTGPSTDGTTDVGFFTRPDFYSEPRRVQLGFEFNF